jgi:hypothetical protein
MVIWPHPSSLFMELGIMSAHDTSLFIAFFHYNKNGDVKHSKYQAHKMDGVVVGRSPISKSLLAYNPWNKQYYKPNSYRLYSYQLPSLVYLNVKFDGSLFCYLLLDDNPSIEEK